MSVRRRHLLLVIATAMLGARALTPLGYMPAAQGSGLLYELCPDGMPAAIMQALSGHGHHHHHHDAESGAASEACPIGHMLASTFAVDVEHATESVPAAADFPPPARMVPQRRTPTQHRSRAPPA